MSWEGFGEYAMKAIAAGTTILKMKSFLGTDQQELTLTRDEVESIMMAFKEFGVKLKQTKLATSDNYDTRPRPGGTRP